MKLADVYQDDRFDRSTDEKTGFRTKSLLCVPVREGSNTIAVLQAINKNDGSEFTDEDQEIFDAFCLEVAPSFFSSFTLLYRTMDFFSKEIRGNI